MPTAGPNPSETPGVSPNTGPAVTPIHPIEARLGTVSGGRGGGEAGDVAPRRPIEQDHERHPDRFRQRRAGGPFVLEQALSLLRPRCSECGAIASALAREAHLHGERRFGGCERGQRCARDLFDPGPQRGRIGTILCPRGPQDGKRRPTGASPTLRERPRRTRPLTPRRTGPVRRPSFATALLNYTDLPHRTECSAHARWCRLLLPASRAGRASAGPAREHQAPEREHPRRRARSSRRSRRSRSLAPRPIVPKRRRTTPWPRTIPSRPTRRTIPTSPTRPRRRPLRSRPWHRRFRSRPWRRQLRSRRRAGSSPRARCAGCSARTRRSRAPARARWRSGRAPPPGRPGPSAAHAAASPVAAAHAAASPIAGASGRPGATATAATTTATGGAATTGPAARSLGDELEVTDHDLDGLCRRSVGR